MTLIKSESDAAARPSRAPRKKSASATDAAPAERGKPRDPPTAGKPLQTYERLIAATGELLGEIGFERLTTNAICARANLSPPAFYHYFDDKYDILEVLARRLLKRQNDAYAAWLFKGGAWANPDKAIEALEEWFAIATQILESEPGAFWTMRALRALPNLAHVRLESQRQSADQMFEFYRRLFPAVDPDTLWCRLRIRSEFGWAVDELALEEDRIPRPILLREAARLLTRSLDDDHRAKPSA
ncbi:TetR/AcrR family transcriptional regulator [Caulobacter segnis]|uniref:Transcriptional regulator, TetR family n=2 Tax=Caulobacter segnis TaxID=88688 RepID=D5VLU5_CAUST|nr:TetR/AcrR family transcriptional regulator [Caulobacter segnis]ADG11468.1 transcriptional regulator, TetR family [Caulobacter segnis ATCC 21756]AVQ03129.1 TetR/AcrR family transcriptional regulator [Caulobacter segnis]